MRGRHPSGAEYVAQLAGSPQAKARLQAVLETMQGTLRVQEACARLGVSEARFHELRREILTAALERLEPRPAGRPKAAAPHPTVVQLEQQVAALAIELRAAQTRAELAVALPQVVQAAGPEKKTRRRPPRRWEPRPRS